MACLVAFATPTVKVKVIATPTLLNFLKAASVFMGIRSVLALENKIVDEVKPSINETAISDSMNKMQD